MLEKKAKKLLKQVQSTYNEIAEEFSDTRQTSWEEFDFFSPYLKPGAEIVDLGCGNGRILKFLAKKTAGWDQPAFRYIGIDNSQKLLEKALQINPQQTFIFGDQLEIPIAENKVDLLFSIAAFHHLPSQRLQQQALLEMKRTLKKDGILIMTVWNLWQKKYWSPILKAILRSIFSLGFYHPGDLFIPWGQQKIPRYYHAFTPGELEKLLLKTGFEIMELFCAKRGKKVPFKQSQNICIIAKKCLN